MQITFHCISFAYQFLLRPIFYLFRCWCFFKILFFVSSTYFLCFLLLRLLSITQMFSYVFCFVLFTRHICVIVYAHTKSVKGDNSGSDLFLTPLKTKIFKRSLNKQLLLYTNGEFTKKYIQKTIQIFSILPFTPILSPEIYSNNTITTTTTYDNDDYNSSSSSSM